MKKRFTDEHIVGFLREAETGILVKELCRQHSFSEASYYLWRSKFGGMNVSDAKRLKDLEAENARLKKLLAESRLENEVTREALRSLPQAIRTDNGKEFCGRSMLSWVHERGVKLFPDRAGQTQPECLHRIVQRTLPG
ncbi:transposase [Pandoraea communis]|uniref:Transposase n=1 Tax=Pandoraea communis TaxID=2508297 RepID=A0A5E4UL26_9BURK|nr:transposase [Pandoraea communis]